MIDIVNVFIVALLAGAAWLGVSAVVRKRFARRHKDTPHGDRHAA